MFSSCQVEVSGAPSLSDKFDRSENYSTMVFKPSAKVVSRATFSLLATMVSIEWNPEQPFFFFGSSGLCFTEVILLLGHKRAEHP